ncbi:MAG: GTPase RsgA [Cytophagales bacterium]|nr:GTPase RsgA [Cytophagales bacterium]
MAHWVPSWMFCRSINELARKNPGVKMERQILAANVDAALIVQGLDRDFNIMRLERCLVQLAACNILPIVVLNRS